MNGAPRVEVSMKTAGVVRKAGEVRAVIVDVGAKRQAPEGGAEIPVLYWIPVERQAEEKRNGSFKVLR